MGTFHDDRGELHGITVVVDTKGPHVYVGRCDVYDDRRIILKDADVFEDGRDGGSKQDYIRRVALTGHWGKHERIQVARADIASVQKLGHMPR